MRLSADGTAKNDQCFGYGTALAALELAAGGAAAEDGEAAAVALRAAVMAERLR